MDEFKDIVSGIRWLELDDNRRLFGTAEEVGPLYTNFSVVRDVLRRNRPDVYDAQAGDYLTREFIPAEK